MNETSFKSVSNEVLNQEPVLETLQVAEQQGGKVFSPSETMFASKVGFVRAVEMTGKNKGTLSRDSKSGKLPFEVSETGQKLFKVSDLYTLYGLQNPEETKFQNQKKPIETKKETEADSVELAVLQERLRSQEMILSMKDAQIRDLQASRDKLLEQNNRLTLLLPAPVASVETVIAASETRKPWWKRILG
jgi:hypothetical protein